ncbi:cell wall / vacuolar inhibitor of fructosidase 2-like [Rosa chinensis]|uniref:cell wall / vacuolar inhibitor of fructosidase 2-like n=1 Tax=Rosa chinensis TaxID=74649 RepID=UPI000D08DBA2|nr:cell wall / vacuolar inhibitor of fructosidase 2-like [Rosa chinensis]
MDVNLIEETCRNTPKPKLCVDSLYSVPQSASADVKGLAHIMNDVVLRTKAQEVHTKIDLLIKQGTRPQSLLTCAQTYSLIINDKIKAVNDGLKDDQPLKTEQAMVDTVSLLNDCNSGLEHSLPGTPLIGMNTNVADLATVTKAIVKQLP